MRVVILGSGVVGVASAWYLNQAGHEVTVIDREPGAALETTPSKFIGSGPNILVNTPWKPVPRMPGKSPPDMLHRGRHQVCL